MTFFYHLCLANEDDNEVAHLRVQCLVCSGIYLVRVTQSQKKKQKTSESV
jgi:hypothetical protein